MNWLEIQIEVLDTAAGAVKFAVNWLLQSSMLIAVGLAIGTLLRGRGAAVQSVILRTTLVAALVCPLATWGLSLAGVSGWSIHLPRAWSPQAAGHTVAAEALSDPAAPSQAAASRVVPAVSPLPLEAEMTRDTASNSPPALVPDEMPAREITTTMSDTMMTEHVAGPMPEPRLAAISVHRIGILSLAATAIWLCISMVLISRLATAWLRLGRLRRRAVPADADTLGICREFASLLNVSVPDVLCAPYLPSPCLAGIRRPAVLLPEADRRLPIREVLIHELAHLRRRDCHWNLLRQIATSIFFFQPLLWKLSRSLESTAEEVCDDYVVQFGGDRQQYAHQLVDIVELSSAPIAAAGVGIVSLRSMLAKRVARIMDSSRTLSTRAGNLLLLAVIVGGLVGTTITGLVGLAPSASQAKTSSEGERDADEGQPVDAAGGNVAGSGKVAAEGNRSLEFAGSVVDPAGQPVEDAQLYLVFHVPQPTGLLTPTWAPVASTDPAGKFRFTASSADFGVHANAREFDYGMLVAVKDGFGFAWSRAGMYETSGKWLRDARDRLKRTPVEFREGLQHMLRGDGEPLKLVADDQPLHGRIVDINGQPVAGARLTLIRVYGGIGDDLSAWRQAAAAPKADYYTARMETPLVINGPQVRSLVKPTMTDADGRFTLRGLGQGRIAELLLEGRGIESAKIYARTEAGDKIQLPRHRDSPDLGSYIYHPAELMIVAGPSVAITGVVRDAETEEPLAGVTVKSQSRHGERINGWGQDFVRAVTDADGRFQLEGMPIGRDNRIAAIAPAGQVPYLSMSKPASTSSQKSPLEVNFDLIRGVWIEGRITDKQTGKGLSGRLAYYVKNDSPSYQFARSLRVDQRDRLLSDDEGHFRIAALPGPGFVTFMADNHQDYPRADAILKADGAREKVGRTMLETGPNILITANYHIVAEINPVQGTKTVELNLQLDGGKSVVGRAVDPNDEPLTGYYYTGQMAQFDTWKMSDGDQFELKGHDPDVSRHAYFIHHERNLAGHLLVRGAQSKDPIVKLQPAGRVTGRLVDEDGAPLANCQLVPWSPPMRSPADAAHRNRAPPLPRNTASRQTGQYETDEEGRFQISHLVPGVEYRIRAFDRASMNRGRAPKFSGPLETVIRVGPGESIDLGDVRIADDGVFQNAKKEPSALQTKPQSLATGKITDTDGKPAAGAHVAVVAMRIQPTRGGDLSSPGDVLAEGRADTLGRFQLNFTGSSKTHRYASLIARSDGMALAWKRINLDEPPVNVSLKLPLEELITGKLVDLEGQPAAAVQLSIQSVIKRSDDGMPNRDGVGFRADRAPAAWLAPVTTDEQGRFTIRGVPKRHGVFLQVAGSDRVAPQSIALNTGMPEQRGERDATYRALVKNVNDGEEAVLPLAPAQLFEGVITFEDTGQPAPHARLTIWASQQEYGSMVSVPGTADAEGRYRISPKPGIRFGLTAYPPDATPYLARQTPPGEGIRWRDGDRVRQVDISLPRGVLVQGTIIEAGSNAPIPGATIQYVPEGANNPNTADDIVTGWQGIQLSNDQGEFEIAVLPGPGWLLVHAPQGGYVLQEIAGRQLRNGKPGGERNYAHAIERLNPDADTAQIEMTISVQPGASVAGQIVDPQGQLVEEALVISRLKLFPHSITWRGHTHPTLGGQFELSGLQSGRDYPTYVLDAQRRLGATVDLRAENSPTTVQLTPCGEAQARFVDGAGQPQAGFRPGLRMVVTPGEPEHDFDAARRGKLLADSDFVANIDQTNYRPGPVADDQGMVIFPALIPGATYRLLTHEDGKTKVLKQFSVESGERLMLGEITINLDD